MGLDYFRIGDHPLRTAQAYNLHTRRIRRRSDGGHFRKRLGDKRTSAKPIDPIVIYENLDRASDKGPLRPAQKVILDDWHQHRRADKDVIIKMHTGQGKTLIGLLILQAKLNEDLGPALYLCPNNHLVDQTVSQAKQFGITCAVAPGDIPTEFLESKQILVTSVQKLFNGLTKFKLGAKSQAVGAIVMDDCHACIDAIREHCVIEIPRTHRAYDALLAVFGPDLKEQGAGTFADIREQKFDALLAIPYWSWMDRHEDVALILAKDSSTDEVKYAWPLLKDILRDCLCVISGQGIQISPQLAPLHLFGSFAEAEHRVFMSATVTNDAFLVKGLGLSSNVITSPMVDKNEKWSGEKMILIPSLISSELGRDSIIATYAPPNDKRKYGRVVLAPSFPTANEWGSAGSLVADKKTIYSYVGFDTATEMLLDIDDILGRLRFGVASDSFEAALDELGQALGFETQRPDKEWKQGPDNLWALRDNQYLLIECKNQVDTNRKEINKDETGQMNNSCAWFRKYYGDVPVKNVMVIWTRVVSQAGGFNEPVEIIANTSLGRLAKNGRGFFGELTNADLQNLSSAKIQVNLKAYKLTIEDLLDHYSEEPKQM